MRRCCLGRAPAHLPYSVSVFAMCPPLQCLSTQVSVRPHLSCLPFSVPPCPPAPLTGLSFRPSPCRRSWQLCNAFSPAAPPAQGRERQVAQGPKPRGPRAEVPQPSGREGRALPHPGRPPCPAAPRDATTYFPALTQWSLPGAPHPS